MGNSKISIRTDKLTKIFNQGHVETKAVKNVNLKIPKGKFVSILGHSGSGKTTLLSLIGGLTKPSHGEVIIDGVDIWQLKDKELSILRNKKIGFIFQFASLIPTLNVIDNLVLPTIFSDKKSEDVYERARELLELVGMEDKIYIYPNQLSGGQQRKVAITRAFMNNPEIILADEPTGDLDEESETGVMELFLKMNREKGTTFIMVTHSKKLAMQTAIRFYMKSGVLKRGK